MNQIEIRQSFIDFFVQKGHQQVPSAPLIPHGDKTLLFTNAGMNQFKDIFLNIRQPGSSRVVDSQKCMRVSGKHNDLEDVGHDTYHHTFFEMLGNWSFGDYYKREAIRFAWELLTSVWGLPKDKLWATFYYDDKEAQELWTTETDIRPSQILAFDEKDNFWEMGETGPCGPCSEIHIDLGPEFCSQQNDPTHKCGVNSGCPRYIELWNLVFIQYNKDVHGNLEPLPKRHVDTGMGFERLASVLQGTFSNYETDLFKPIIDHNEMLTGVAYANHPDTDVSIRVIADHVRALTFLIADDIFPSNEGRGYVLRRILRRAVRHGKKLDMGEPFLYKLVSTCIENMCIPYPELKTDPNKIIMLVKKEEERFHKTLVRGFHVLETIIAKQETEKIKKMSGQDMFMLYDTYGFPPDFTREILAEKGIGLDEHGFEDAMFLQKEKGRSGWDGADQSELQQKDIKRFKGLPATIFEGYEQTETVATIIAMFSLTKRVTLLKEQTEAECILDKTPFYGESGGQVGDTGTIMTETCLCQVINTSRNEQGHFIHHVKIVKGELKEGDIVSAKIDIQRRDDIRKNHSSTHILHAVLKEVLGDHVKQAGSLVRPDYFRFDFTHFDKLSVLDFETIEQEINRVILDNIALQTEVTSFDNAVSEGAMALFEDKYSDEVRMIRIPGVSLELCGGTHVQRTGDIGSLKMLHESGVAAGIRRIEAITGRKVLEWINTKEHEMDRIAMLLKTTPDRLEEKVQQLVNLKKELEREIMSLRQALKNEELERMQDEVTTVAGIKTIIRTLENMGIDDLRALSDQLKQHLGQGIVVLLAERDSKVIIVATVTPDLEKSVPAGKLVKSIASIVGGGGGGRPDFAQAGGKDVDKIPEAVAKIPGIIAEMLKK